MNTPTPQNTPTLQERIAALARPDQLILAKRASVSVKTLDNILKGLHKQHAGTVRNIERALGRMKPTPTAEATEPRP
jgi:hypothetical protein